MYEKPFTHAPYSKLNMRILSILQHEGFIISFYHPWNRPDKIQIYLRPPLGDLFRNLKFFTRRSTLSHLSYIELLPLLKTSRFGLVTTTRGVITLKQAYKEKIGGRLLFTI